MLSLKHLLWKGDSEVTKGISLVAEFDTEGGMHQNVALSVLRINLAADCPCMICGCKWAAAHTTQFYLFAFDDLEVRAVDAYITSALRALPFSTMALAAFPNSSTP